MTWQAETLHAVVFHIPAGETPDAFQPWLSVFKAPPQNFQTNPVGSPPGGTASGLIGSYQVLLTANPGRVELVLGATPTSDGPPGLIRDVDQAIATLVLYAKELLKGYSANRVAVVLTLVQRTGSSREAAEVFARETKLPGIPPDALDLGFSVNVRKSFKDSSRTMNRLCRWGTTIQQLVAVQITIGSGEPSLGVQQFPAATLHIDANSLPSDQGEQVTTTAKLIDELAEEVKGILGSGYDYLLG